MNKTIIMIYLKFEMMRMMIKATLRMRMIVMMMRRRRRRRRRGGGRSKQCYVVHAAHLYIYYIHNIHNIVIKCSRRPRAIWLQLNSA